MDIEYLLLNKDILMIPLMAIVIVPSPYRAPGDFLEPGRSKVALWLPLSSPVQVQVTLFTQALAGK